MERVLEGVQVHILEDFGQRVQLRVLASSDLLVYQRLHLEGELVDAAEVGLASNRYSGFSHDADVNHLGVFSKQVFLLERHK